MPKYRYIGDHADIVQKGDKTIPVAPGDFVEMSAKELEEAGVDKEKFIDASEKGGK